MIGPECALGFEFVMRPAQQAQVLERCRAAGCDGTHMIELERTLFVTPRAVGTSERALVVVAFRDSTLDVSGDVTAVGVACTRAWVGDLSELQLAAFGDVATQRVLERLLSSGSGSDGGREAHGLFQEILRFLVDRELPAPTISCERREVGACHRVEFGL